MRKAIVGMGVAAAFSLTMGGTALAGEYNGKGKPVPGGVNGKSECSFSGQDVDDSVEDNPPGFDDDDVTAVGNTRVQSYGILVKSGLKDFLPSPGVACNPSRS
jgi:hypothetical protein